MDAAEVTVSELVAAFWMHAETYYRRLDGSVSHELASCTKVPDCGPRALKTVRHAMIDAGICRQTINQRIGRIRAMFKWGSAVNRRWGSC